MTDQSESAADGDPRFDAAHTHEGWPDESCLACAWDALEADTASREEGASWTAPDGTTYTGPGAVGWAHNPEANRALVAAARADAQRRAAAIRGAGSSTREGEAMPYIVAWMASPLVPCVPDGDGWCPVCSSLTLGVER